MPVKMNHLIHTKNNNFFFYYNNMINLINKWVIDNLETILQQVKYLK